MLIYCLAMANASRTEPTGRRRSTASMGALGMGSLAMLFGLIFLVGLVAAIYKALARRPGALGWMAGSLAGLVLYACLFFFVSHRHMPLKGGPPPPAAHSRAGATASAPATAGVSPSPGKGTAAPTAKSASATTRAVYARPARGGRRENSGGGPVGRVK